LLGGYRVECDGDLIESVRFPKGDQARPLWSYIERLTPAQMISWVDRFDSLSAVACGWALAQALEEAAQLKIPLRLQYVRTIFCEISRLIWLTTYLGRMMTVLGQGLLQEQIFILREQILVIQEELTGGRLLPQILTIGGCRRRFALGDVYKVQQ